MSAPLASLVGRIRANPPDRLTPRALGASGDLSHLDTAFIQAALDLGRELYIPVDLEGRAYLSGPLEVSSPGPGGAWLSAPAILGRQAVIRAAEPCRTLLSARNLANTVLSEIRLEGAGLAQTVLNTTWDISAAPSQNNKYDKIECRGATDIQWIAHGNNDSVFRDILIEAKGAGGAALAIHASGGHVRLLSPTIFNGVVEISCQSLSVIDGVDCGYRIVGLDNNDLTFSGGYHYASDRGRNIELADGVTVTSINAFGGRFENGVTRGEIVGGGGLIAGSVLLEGLHCFATGGAQAIRLAGRTLKSPFGKIPFMLRGGFYTDIDVSDGPRSTVHIDHVTVNAERINKRESLNPGASR
jgi:hypothetical protein